MKIHSRRLHAPLRGIFGPDSVSVARYASIIGTKSPTKWDAQPTESNFQTRPNAASHFFHIFHIESSHFLCILENVKKLMLFIQLFLTNRPAG
ncbi:DUF6783 domain-containing protein [Enterocloster hominis (ex Hitch et al. 2024)]|uniref:DUF6783 domain-containing protein n=1 Tax=Enterocloster hominis (ex Hitch et al. 2024) TaxID=1917870 RepID=UPI002FE6D802